MGYINELSQDVKDEIVRCYKETKLTTMEIQKMYNISAGSLSRIIDMYGIPRRHPGAVGGKGAARKIKYKVCRHCGNKALSAESKFCHICGKPLYTYKEQILNDLQSLTDYVTLINQEDRTKFISSIQDLKKRIEKLKED